MAKQTGPVRLQGTIGGINFYSTKAAGELAREAGGGFNTKTLKTDSRFERCQEIANEMGACTKAKVSLKNALAPLLCVRKDGSLHIRMVKLFFRLKELDKISRRGHRNVARGLETVEGKSLLRGFTFTPECNIMNVLAASYTYNETTQHLKISNFNANNVHFPDDATHIALTLGLAHYDFNTSNSKAKFSTPLYIDKNNIDTSLDIHVDLPDFIGLGIALLGMKFYQKVQGRFYLFKNASAVGVETLWVEQP